MVVIVVVVRTASSRSSVWNEGFRVIWYEWRVHGCLAVRLWLITRVSGVTIIATASRNGTSAAA